MPTYVYRCSNGHEQELRRPVDYRDLPAPCLKCTELMERQPAAPGFVLKGAGFHRNDYAPPRPRPEVED